MYVIRHVISGIAVTRNDFNSGLEKVVFDKRECSELFAFSPVGTEIVRRHAGVLCPREGLAAAGQRHPLGAFDIHL